jgi:hypothetical protein
LFSSPKSAISQIINNREMSFTERRGISTPQTDITIRNDAPQALRDYLFLLMQKYEPSLKKIRKLVCLISMNSEDPNNWGENDFMKEEIQSILNDCHWNLIYDIIENFYSNLPTDKNKLFEKDINAYFINKGIGWKLINGAIITRGDSILENDLKEVGIILEEKGLHTSKMEITEAISDLSRRPKAEITGAIQHSLAALECVCREVTGDKKATLGTIINKNPTIVPSPLDEAIKKIWGFSSQHGRHLQEGNDPEYEEAELLVHLSASLCTYLGKKFNFNQSALHSK